MSLASPALTLDLQAAIRTLRLNRRKNIQDAISPSNSADFRATKNGSPIIGFMIVSGERGHW
jgi:hypothetical protein